MRLALRILGWLGLVLLVSATVLGIYVARNWDRTWDVPEPDLHASTDPAIIARGEYLATGPAHCTECHVPDAETFRRFYEGSDHVPLIGGFGLGLGPLGTLYSKNLTPDTETGIGRYTDPQVARMLRYGVRPDGQATVPLIMPYGNMSDDDLVAILSFLRAQPPVRHVVPENQWTIVGKVMRTFVAAAKPNVDARPVRTAPAQEMTVARGEYLARSVANCAGCHTPFNELTGVATGPIVSGGNTMEPAAFDGVDRSAFFRPPNLTPREGSALMKFPDRATFVARFKVGGRHYDGSPMPWEAFSRLAPEDIGALYEFLHAQPPSGQPSPEDPRVRP